MSDADRAARRKKLRRTLLRWTLIVIGLYAGTCMVLYAFQAKLLYFPLRELEATPKSAGLAYEDVRLDTSDGVRLHAWFLPTENARATMLFCHGNGGNVSHRLDTFRVFHRLGLNTFIFDYRGYGKSEGKPTEEGTYLDAEAAYAYLTDVKGIPGDNIIFFGRSLGGAVAARLATRHTPRALILESTFTSVPDMGAELYPWLPIRAICKYSYNTQAILPGLHCPVLVVHSTEDRLVPFRLGRKLFEVANEPKRFLQITGSHNEGFLTSGTTYADGLDAFISDVLAHVRRSAE